MSPQLSAGSRSRLGKFKHVLSICLLGLLGSSGIASAETFTNITNEAELRAAIDMAIDNQQNDTIELGGRTIALTSELEINLESGFNVEFSGGTLLRSNASPAFRLLNITDQSLNGGNGTTAIFNGTTLRNGLYETANGPADQAGGGALFSDGVDLELTDALIENNTIRGAGTGGAIFLRNASIVAERTVFFNNNADLNGEAGETSGGALGSTNALNITVRDSVFNRNSATRGGAIAPINHQQAMVISGSTFTSNQATTVGGAIWNRSQLSLQTSTFFENTAGTGGGALYLQPTNSSVSVSISRNTFVDNAGTNTAGTLLIVGTASRPDVLGNIIVGSNGTQNCGELNVNGPATFLNDAYNISNDNSCGIAAVVQDSAALFSPSFPTFNGGNNKTIALSATSAAIDTGIPQGNPLCSLDQRAEPAVGDCDVGSYEFQPSPTDGDNDGVPDANDNCPLIANEDQEDRNRNNIGDVCDDPDGDGFVDSLDNCPDFASDDQTNTDGDAKGDVCDDDDDGDGVDDVDDIFPLDAAESEDSDNDGIGNNGDSDDDNDGQSDVNEGACGSDPLDADSISADADADNIPDCVDDDPFTNDSDEDGTIDAEDNCPATPNSDQADNDSDDLGDVCDNDDDNDGVSDVNDAFPFDDSESSDTDNDTIGNNADTDDDNDGVLDNDDAFPLDRTESADNDNDSIGNNADPDDDNDAQSDAHEEQCGSDPLDAESTSPDRDEDGIPDCVDDDFFSDTDEDGFADSEDNCPAIANADQIDTDEDTLGDACDLDDDNDGVSDADDAFPLDDTESVDTDGDLIGNNADLDDDNDAQSDVNEAACGSDPLDAASTSPDADSDGIPDCVDEDVVDDVSPVTVFQHVNYRGNSFSAGLGDVSIGELRNSSVGNDRISSIRIAPGYAVYACQHSRFRGRCETFTNDTSDLRDIQFNDVISSFRVTLAPVVTVYQHVNYRGNSLSVGLGDVTLRDLRISRVGNDVISSIRIAPGYEVYACQHGGFRGRCETFTNDTPDLRDIQFNDVISSLRVSLGSE